MFKRFVAAAALVCAFSTAFGAEKGTCPSICVDAFIMDGRWVLMTVDSTGRVLQMEKTEVGAEQPLREWFGALQYNPLDLGASTRDDQNAPPPPPDGTGTVSESYSSPGWNGDDYGVWFVIIKWVYMDFRLVDIRATSFFKKMPPVEPPGGNQQN
ncbi:MAG: hypothetical protein Kow0020_16240 [Wenzhouxiangellaceae bacterium]